MEPGAHLIVTETKQAGADSAAAQSLEASERCKWLRRHTRDLEYRVANAAPWEREKQHFRLAAARHQERQSCR
jgi:hypothetical protein